MQKKGTFKRISVSYDPVREAKGQITVNLRSV
jgi:hypothetical protein